MPPGVIRPAMSRMREALFAVLGDLTDRPFLDLFSGSGLVGLEAWSRAARPVVLVERDRGKRTVILRNLEGLERAPRLMLAPVEAWIQRNRTPFDVIYLDPPFSYAYKDDLLVRLAASPTPSASDLCRIVIHHPSVEHVTAPRGWQIVDVRQFGGSTVTFLGRGRDSPTDELLP